MKTPTKTKGTFNSNHMPKGRAEPVGTGHSLRFWQRMLGAGLLGLLLLAGAVSRTLPAPGMPPGAVTWAPARRAGDHSINYYFQSGQWRADMRTLASMFHYLMTPDSRTGTVMPA